MKKVISTVAISALIGAGAFAQSNVVTSANVVGYVTLTVPADSLSMIANQFINASQTDMTISQIFGTSLADGTALYVFNPGTGYLTYNYVDGLGWVDENFDPADDVVISRGQGFWIQNVGATPMTVTLAGDVPGNAFGAATNSLPEGLKIVSSSYPVDRKLSELGISATDGDAIYIYNNGYSTYNYVDGLGWVDENFDPADDVVVPAGIGFWFQTGTAKTWVQSKPYSNF